MRTGNVKILDRLVQHESVGIVFLQRVAGHSLRAGLGAVQPSCAVRVLVRAKTAIDRIPELYQIVTTLYGGQGGIRTPDQTVMSGSKYENGGNPRSIFAGFG